MQSNIPMSLSRCSIQGLSYACLLSTKMVEPHLMVQGMLKIQKNVDGKLRVFWYFISIRIIISRNSSIYSIEGLSYKLLEQKLVFRSNMQVFGSTFGSQGFQGIPACHYFVSLNNFPYNPPVTVKIFYRLSQFQSTWPHCGQKIFIWSQEMSIYICVYIKQSTNIAFCPLLCRILFISCFDL